MWPPMDDDALMQRVQSTLSNVELGDDSLQEALLASIQSMLGGADDPPKENKPHLRLVDKPEGELKLRPGAPDPKSDPAPEPPLLLEGRIKLRPTLEGVFWQTLFVGTGSRLYRVGCTSGHLEVEIDGDIVARLKKGQSIDVQGSRLRVRASDCAAADGRYVPVD